MKKALTIFVLILLFANTTHAFTFNRSLNIGATGEDVKQLQIFLNNYSTQTQISSYGAGSSGNETTYFGNLTKEAVKRFQNLNFNEILKPVNLNSGTGYFGPSTINFVNSILINQNTENISSNSINTTTTANVLSNKPVIYSISPDKGTDGTEITIKGSGFTDDNTIISGFEKKDKYINYESNELGTEITFTIDSRLQDKFEEQTKKLSSREKRNVLDQIVDIPIAISIENSGGQSNYKIFNFEYK